MAEPRFLKFSFWIKTVTNHIVVHVVPVVSRPVLPIYVCSHNSFNNDAMLFWCLSIKSAPSPVFFYYFIFNSKINTICIIASTGGKADNTRCNYYLQPEYPRGTMLLPRDTMNHMRKLESMRQPRPHRWAQYTILLESSVTLRRHLFCT